MTFQKKKPSHRYHPLAPRHWDFSLHLLRQQRYAVVGRWHLHEAGTAAARQSHVQGHGFEDLPGRTISGYLWGKWSANMGIFSCKNRAIWWATRNIMEYICQQNPKKMVIWPANLEFFFISKWGYTGYFLGDKWPIRSKQGLTQVLGLKKYVDQIHTMSEFQESREFYSTK